jgi:hypothetical protein
MNRDTKTGLVALAFAAGLVGVVALLGLAGSYLFAPRVPAAPRPARCPGAALTRRPADVIRAACRAALPPLGRPATRCEGRALPTGRPALFLRPVG